MFFLRNYTSIKHDIKVQIKNVTEDDNFYKIALFQTDILRIWSIKKNKILWLDIGTCFDTPKFRCNSGKNMNIYVIGLPLIMGHAYALSY